MTAFFPDFKQLFLVFVDLDSSLYEPIDSSTKTTKLDSIRQVLQCFVQQKSTFNEFFEHSWFQLFSILGEQPVELTTLSPIHRVDVAKALASNLELPNPTKTNIDRSVVEQCILEPTRELLQRSVDEDLFIRVFVFTNRSLSLESLSLVAPPHAFFHWNVITRMHESGDRPRPAAFHCRQSVATWMSASVQLDNASPTVRDWSGNVHVDPTQQPPANPPRKLAPNPQNATTLTAPLRAAPRKEPRINFCCCAHASNQ